MKFSESLSALLDFIKREKLHRLLLVLVILILVSTVGILIFEPNITPINAFWWSIVTLTTVGYGDIAPTTLGGRLIGILIMFFGIGLLGMFTATIASVFVENKLQESRGMKSYNFTGHILLCGWNLRAREILREFRTDPRTREAPVVLIADIETKPVNDKQLYFIQGEVNEESLQRANLAQAATVVILGDNRLDENARDAKVVLSTLTVESLNPNVYTIVELVNEANVRHCERARADEIIVGNEFSSRLLARAALDHGISKVLSELLSSRYGNELYKIPVPADLVGRSFLEVFTEMKRTRQATVLGVQKGGNGRVLSNPPADYQIAAADNLIIIADSRLAKPGQ